MAVQLPYRSDGSVPRPSAVGRHGNGKLPSSLLQPCGIRSFVMVEPAARAMRAMVAAAAGDGVTISGTGTWRSYDQQLWLFKDRYVTWNTGQSSKTWNGTRYWKKPGVAAAATPGTSNHGWGVAADLSDTPMVPLSDKTQRWLAAHGPSFGYWNTVQSELWHWSYCLGDDVPSAVEDVEAGGGVEPPPTIDWTSVEEVEKALADLDYPGLLKKGSTGVAVSAVQWKLNTVGLDLVVDGDFGPNTAKAVRGFQKMNGLEVDGIVGQVTWGALGLDGGVQPSDTPKRKKKRAAGKKRARKKAAASTGTGESTEDAAGAAEPTAEDEATYTVQDGDGLLRVARLTLWSKRMSDAKAIARTNGLELDSLITPGDELRIEKCRSTTVTRGDGWLAVSKRLGRSADEVLENNAWQGDVLHPGMTIYGGKAD